MAAAVAQTSGPFGVHTPAPARLGTPRSQLKSIRSRRVIASAIRQSHVARGEEPPQFEGLLKKTWKTYSLSPLYKFDTSPGSFRVYARSLDAALSQGISALSQSGDSGTERSAFEVYEGLSNIQSDPEAVRIQVLARNTQGTGQSIVLTAFLVCVNLEDSPVDRSLAGQFTYYPILLLAANKARSQLLLTWLERHFDCRSDLLTFSDTDMRWLFFFGSTQVRLTKNCPVLLQYSLANVCTGIKTMDCRLESHFCEKLWDRMCEDRDSEMEERLDDSLIKGSDMCKFVTALEDHLEYTMSFVLSKLELCEIGTPMAYVSKDGKLKVMSSAGSIMVLSLISSMAAEKFSCKS